MISDLDLARLWRRLWKPAPGDYIAPAARVSWDGNKVKVKPLARLAPEAALIAPDLATAINTALQARHALPAEPTIAQLVSDYASATSPFKALPAASFAARLESCRLCSLWEESARGGRGRCNSVRCACSKRLLWLPSDQCPESRWPL